MSVLHFFYIIIGVAALGGLIGILLVIAESIETALEWRKKRIEKKKMEMERKITEMGRPDIVKHWKDREPWP